MSVLPIHKHDDRAQPAVTHPKVQSQLPPRSKKRISTCLGLFLVLSWIVFSLYTNTVPQTMATQTQLPAAAVESADSSSILPSNAEPSSKDLIKLMDLPPNYLPKTGKHRHGARLIVVGDVHGMKQSLEHLLHKVKFDKAHDHLILAGDMISKGPDSKGVVDLAMKLGATGIRGNHEDRVLLAYKKWRKSDEDITDSDEVEFLEDSDEEDETAMSEGEIEIAGKRKKDRKLIKKLGKHRLQWLNQCPVILRVGKLGKMGEVVVVHAGLVPGVELRRQDSVMVMNMRTIDDDGVPSDGRKGTPWIKVYSSHYFRRPRGC